MIHNNVVQKVESMKGKIKTRYGIDLSQTIELSNHYTDRFELVCAAFDLGYMQGMKVAKADMKKAGAAV